MVLKSVMYVPQVKVRNIEREVVELTRNRTSQLRESGSLPVVQFVFTLCSIDSENLFQQALSTSGVRRNGGRHIPTA